MAGWEMQNRVLRGCAVQCYLSYMVFAPAQQLLALAWRPALACAPQRRGGRCRAVRKWKEARGGWWAGGTGGGQKDGRMSMFPHVSRPGLGVGGMGGAGPCRILFPFLGLICWHGAMWTFAIDGAHAGLSGPVATARAYPGARGKVTPYPRRPLTAEIPARVAVEWHRNLRCGCPAVSQLSGMTL